MGIPFVGDDQDPNIVLDQECYDDSLQENLNDGMDRDQADFMALYE